MAQEGRLGRSTLAIPTEATRRAAIEKVFGPIADALLAKEGILTDGESRWRVIEETARAMDDAARKLKRNAEGDYRPDDAAARFPAWAGAAAKRKGAVSVMQLFEKWKKANPRDSAAPKGSRAR
jgi:hypothetical protein